MSKKTVKLTQTREFHRGAKIRGKSFPIGVAMEVDLQYFMGFAGQEKFYQDYFKEDLKQLRFEILGLSPIAKEEVKVDESKTEEVKVDESKTEEVKVKRGRKKQETNELEIEEVK